MECIDCVGFVRLEFGRIYHGFKDLSKSLSPGYVPDYLPDYPRPRRLTCEEKRLRIR